MTDPRPLPKPVTPKYLENAALHYLERFANSAEGLRRVLMRKVDRSVRAHGTDREQAAGWVDELIQRYRSCGLLDDAAYAQAKAASLHRRGASARGIRGRLASKGIDAELIGGALEELVDGDPAAALAFARRRRLGPFRPETQRAQFRDKDLAALGRAGFDYATARAVIDNEN